MIKVNDITVVLGKKKQLRSANVSIPRFSLFRDLPSSLPADKSINFAKKRKREEEEKKTRT